MYKALISHLDIDEGRAPTPFEGPPHALVDTHSIDYKLEKVKFPEFLGAPEGAATEAWLEGMAMCFALRNYTFDMKVRMAVFQLKGSALLWWKALPPQLNLVVEDASWEPFEERFRERYLPEEFIERSSMSSTLYDRKIVRCSSARHVLWRCSGTLRTLT
jgi:hypothetical protein